MGRINALAMASALVSGISPLMTEKAFAEPQSTSRLVYQVMVELYDPEADYHKERVCCLDVRPGVPAGCICEPGFRYRMMARGGDYGDPSGGLWWFDVRSRGAKKPETDPLFGRLQTSFDEIDLEITVAPGVPDVSVSRRFNPYESHEFKCQLGVGESRKFSLTEHGRDSKEAWIAVTLIGVGIEQASSSNQVPVDTPPPTSRPLTHRPADEQTDDRSIFQFIVGFTR